MYDISGLYSSSYVLSKFITFDKGYRPETAYIFYSLVLTFSLCYSYLSDSTLCTDSTLVPSRFVINNQLSVLVRIKIQDKLNNYFQSFHLFSTYRGMGNCIVCPDTNTGCDACYILHLGCTC